MKLTLILSLVLAQVSFVFSQDVTELYFDTFDARKYSHISVDNSCGTVIVEPSDNEMGARVEFSFDEEVSIQAAKLKGKISIEKTIRNDSIILTTVFDESIFAQKNILWEIKDNINIEYRVLVPRKASTSISQKYGKVIVGRNAFPVAVKLDNAELFAEMSENLKVEGIDFEIEASDVKELSVIGTGGKLILGNTGIGYLELTNSTVESLGFESLRGQLDNSSLFCGMTRSCQVTANNCTIEFSDITSKGICDVKDTRLVIQKLPPEFQVRSVGGSSTYNMTKDRECELNLYTEENNTEIYLRGGTMRMDYIKKKKTEMDLPFEAVVTKERAVLAQRENHTVNITAEFVGGQFLMKK